MDKKNKYQLYNIYLKKFRILNIASEIQHFMYF